MFKALIRVIHKYLLSSILLRRTGCVCANRHLFQRTGLQKMRELYILCLEGVLVSQTRVRTRGCAAIWRIFSANKSVPANWNKGFCKPLYQRMGRLESFLVTLFKNSESRLKSMKHIAVYILSWAYLVVSLLGGSTVIRL